MCELCCPSSTQLRYVWYHAHLAIKREATIRRGVVAILKQSPNFTVALFDRIKQKNLAKVIQAMPLKVRASHYCFTQGSTQLMILPVVKYFMTREVRHRFITHGTGTNCARTLNQTFNELSRFGFRAGGLPPCLGGTFELNRNWVQDQLVMEEQNSSNKV
mmetsp:Transcript_29308/g.41214  ORF Transcript_29308/g.41214 Transcript_29308/m.41214 type:complete len:160 (+) Transcript_29308:752-1231(+)